MKLALECPVELLKDMQPLADFDWILAHLVLSDGKYAAYYANSTRFKVLDNSANELLQPCSLSDIKKAVGIVKPDLIVPPDYLGDSSLTERSLEEAIGMFGEEKLLPCVQGSELKYVLECAEYIRKLGFDRVAVPYDITCSRGSLLEEMARRRQVAAGLLTDGFKDIHLLGMTTLKELESYKSMPQVVSIDTGSPILHGLLGLKFGLDGLLPKATSTMSWMGLLKKGITEALGSVFYNISYLRRIINE